MTGQQVALVRGAAGAGYAGLAYCGSVWVCPPCAAIIRAQRAEEIQAAMVAHVERGGGGLFVTLTLPHQARDSLHDLVRIVAGGWARVRGGSSGQDWWRRIGALGAIRSLEVTHGARGWHPHLHVLIVTTGRVSDADAAAFKAYVEARWIAWATSQGARAPSAAHGVDCQQVVDARGVARYVSKVQDDAGTKRLLGHELARGDLKRGRGKGKTPFELLAALDGAEGLPRARLVKLWREYEAAMRGLSSVRWSRGLRLALRAGVEASDEDLAGDVDNAGAEVVFVMTGETWRAVWRAGLRTRLLELAELGEDEAARSAADSALREELLALAAACEAHNQWEPPPEDDPPDWWAAAGFAAA
jgi:hypothetical protein